MEVETVGEIYSVSEGERWEMFEEGVSDCEDLEGWEGWEGVGVLEFDPFVEFEGLKGL